MDEYVTDCQARSEMVKMLVLASVPEKKIQNIGVWRNLYSVKGSIECLVKIWTKQLWKSFPPDSNVSPALYKYSEQFILLSTNQIPAMYEVR